MSVYSSRNSQGSPLFCFKLKVRSKGTKFINSTFPSLCQNIVFLTLYFLFLRNLDTFLFGYIRGKQSSSSG